MTSTFLSAGVIDEIANESSSSGRYINPSKLTGEKRLRFFGEGVTGYSAWTLDKKPIRWESKPAELPADLAPDLSGKISVKRFLAGLVYDYEAADFKILEITQRTLMDQLFKFMKDEDYGDPTTYDIKIIALASDGQLSSPAFLTATTLPGDGSPTPHASSSTVTTGGSSQIVISGISNTAILSIGALQRGVSSAVASGQTVRIVTARGFSGVISQPVTIRDAGSDTVIHITVVVNPAIPARRQFTATSGTSGVVTWGAADGAIGYVVTVGGRQVCQTAASPRTCTIAGLLGPRSNVRIRSLGADATTSAAVLASWRRPAQPVTLLTIGFGASGKALTSATAAQVRAMARSIAALGMTRVEVRGYSAATGQTAADIRSQLIMSKVRAQACAAALTTELAHLHAHVSVIVRWFGAGSPQAANTWFGGRLLNRRAEIVLS